MNRVTASIGLAALASGLAVAAGVVPSEAQAFTPSVTVTGTATCQRDLGYEAWDMQWTITNTSTGEATTSTSTTTTLAVPGAADGSHTMSTGPVGPGAITIEWGNLSGAWTSHFDMGYGFEVDQGESFVVSSWAPNSAVGEVTGSFGWTYDGGPTSISSATVTLDGSCTLAAAVAPAVAPAVEAQPAVTG